MLKYIIAFIVIALAWTICYVLKLPWIVAVAATILVLFVLLAIFLYRRFRARKAAREIEKALNAQAEEQARSARPEQQAEVRAMQAEVNRAINALKGSRLGGKGGIDALYALPWYVIVGPPGSGKTTALRNSGIPFPYMSAQTGGGVRGVGGTRNCEWWLSNEGVLLDTAGRYMTNDDDREEWLSFLDLLKKNRPGKPLNGIIVAVNVAELGSSREQQVEATARRVRERVDEVQARLQLSLPVYVLFTKCDLVQGFTEFFDDLRKSERGQIWGFTVPLARPVDASPSALFTERFEEMTRGIEARALKRLSQEPALNKREALYQFPQQFASLKQNLGEFLDALFASNVYQSAPTMRGVYFTSGTQEGRPIDQLAEKLRASFGLPAAPAAPTQAPTEQKSYFLRDVFAKVVFPDQHVAALSAEERTRLNRQKYYFAAGAFGLAALLSVIPANAYLENRELVQRCDDAQALIRARRSRAGDTMLRLNEIEAVRSVVAELKGYEDGHAPFSMTFGMYQGAALYPRMSTLYAAAMQHDVVSLLYAADARDMETFAQSTGDGVPTMEQRTDYHNRLKLHLLLSAPKANDEPELKDAVATFAGNQLASEWAGRVPAGTVVDDGVRRAMLLNAQLYTSLLHDTPRLALQRNASVVASTRRILLRTSTIDLELQDIINSVDSSYNIDLGGAIGRTPTYLSQTGPDAHHIVRGAFTRRGWEDVVRARLKQAPDRIAGEAWVLGERPNLTAEQQRLETLVNVRSQYFSQYIDEWRNFLRAIRVRPPANAEAAHTMLTWFTEGRSPPVYEFLFTTLGENIRLNDPDEAGTGAASASVLQSIEREISSRLQRTRTGTAADQALRAARAARTTDDGPSTFVHRVDVENNPMLHGLVVFGVPQMPPRQQQDPNAPPQPPPTPSPTALNGYQEQLAFVRNKLYDYMGNPREGLQPLQEGLRTAQTTIRPLIDNAHVDSRPVLEQLLPPPLEFTVTQVMHAAGGASSDRWCSAVVVPFHRTLFDHYPFNPNGQDAAIADLNTFYQPTTGALWAFYAQDLATYVPRVGDEYQFTTQNHHPTSEMYRAELAQFLNRSQDITTVFFPPTPPNPQQGAAAPTGPKVEFEVRVRPAPTIAETIFNVDGDEFRYTNGPEEWHRFTWPGAGGRFRGAKIRARGLNGIDETIEQDGEWGIFRLFDLAQVRGNANARIFSVTWHLRDQNLDVGVDVRPARAENPFFGIPRRADNADRYLSPVRSTNVDPPHPIASGRPPCQLSDVPGSGTPSHHHRRHH